MSQKMRKRLFREESDDYAGDHDDDGDGGDHDDDDTIGGQEDR